MLTRSRVIVVGSINFDIIAPVADPPMPHQKQHVPQYSAGPGGAAVNTARWLASMGVATELVGVVGDDTFGQACLDGLIASGVGIAMVSVMPGSSTGLAFVMSRGDAKRMFTFPGPDRDAAFGLAVLDELRAEDHVHIAAPVTDGLRRLLAGIETAGCSMSLEWNGRDMRTLTRSADLNFMNLDEARALTGAPAGHPAAAVAAMIAADLTGDVVLTLGASGALRANADGLVAHQPVEPVDPVDRTGGGDAFDAGVIVSWLLGEPAEAGLRRGLAAARTTLMMVGACP